MCQVGPARGVWARTLSGWRSSAKPEELVIPHSRHLLDSPSDGIIFKTKDPADYLACDSAGYFARLAIPLTTHEANFVWQEDAESGMLAVSPAARQRGQPILCAIHANPDRARQLGAKDGRGNRHVPTDIPAEPTWPPRNIPEVKLLLRRNGERVSRKEAASDLFREAGLMIRRKKRKHCVRIGPPLPSWTAANQEWALDFAQDAAACGRAIRVLSVVDAYTRGCLALGVDTSFASRRVTRVLEAIVAERGQPKAIRCDNGPELTRRHFLAWSVERQIELLHIEPGTPTQNAHMEGFHGRLREGCLAVS